MGWNNPPKNEDDVRQRLSLYFALCARSGPTLLGLFQAYADVPADSILRKVS